MKLLKTIISFIVLLGHTLITFSQESFLESNDVQVVLLAGQSNMAGGGNYDELDDETKKRVEKAAQNVSLSFNGKPAKPLSYYVNKPTEKYNFTKRFGPELLLGVSLAEQYPMQEFLLIKRSQGGTALYGAWNPNWDAEKSIAIEKGKFKQSLKLYELHISDIKRNLEILESQNKTYNIFGLAWMQGENDAILWEAAKSYKNNLGELVYSYRKDLNVSEMPFVLGQTNSRYGVENGAKTVREQMIKFANQDYYSKLIETTTDIEWNDFPKHFDNVHYNTEGQKRLGVAFFEGFLAIQKKLNVDEFQSMDQLVPGVTTTFKAKGETNMIYHVYTPSNFSLSKKAPIVVAFSPQGRGNNILYKMKPSVEKLGWILVGVDKLKNGMKDRTREIKMEDEALNDIFKNITHDSNKIYLAGFSGGAWRAYQLTTRRSEIFKGIIAYGGWLGGDNYQDKDYQDGLDVAIINGLKDKGANAWIEKDAQTLKKHGATVKLFRHDGGHKIAPTEVTEEAFKWLLESQSKK